MVSQTFLLSNTRITGKAANAHQVVLEIHGIKISWNLIN